MEVLRARAARSVILRHDRLVGEKGYLAKIESVRAACVLELEAVFSGSGDALADIPF
jgi:hypothetical protein